jgi:hypothetical protein
MKRCLISSFIFTSSFLCLGKNSIAQTKVAVYVTTNGKDTLSELVSLLQAQLNKSTPVSFQQFDQAGFNGKGILLSTDRVRWKQYASPLLKMGAEAMYLKGTGNAIIIIGNSQMAVQHGVFMYLEKLGYRYYFTHPDWHIIPATINLFPAITYLGQPAFNHRRIWYGYGTGSKIADADYNFWVKANRLGGCMNASYGHAYDDIVVYNPDEFKKHPEWLYPRPPAGTLVTSNPKFDMTNEELVQFLIKDVFKRIDKSLANKTGDYKMISMGPSDGNGTCNSPACQKLGTMSDRVYYLVNRIASAVRKKYPETLIGCLAYTEYIEPPTHKTEPNVYVAITTGFNPSKYSTEELVKKWTPMTGTVGIYDYFGLFAWDQDSPGQSLTSQIPKMIINIRKFYKAGAKGYEGESSIGWISKGLGHFLAAKLMWDVNTNVEKYENEFFDLCFRKASPLIKKMWLEWETYSYAQPREGDLARWIDWTKQAAAAEPDAGVQKRLFQVKSYLHYLYLLRNYRGSKSEADLLSLLSFGYRMLDYGCIAGYPAFFELGHLSKIPGMSGYDPNAKWRSNKSTVTVAELNSLLNSDRSKLKGPLQLQTFAIANSFKKVPGVEKYTGPVYDGSQADNKLWYQGEWLMQVKAKGVGNFIEVSGGYVTGDAGPKPIRVSIYPFTENGDVSGLQPIMTYNYTNRYKYDTIQLAKLNPGYYTVIVDDPVKIYTIRFSKPINYSMVIRSSRQLRATWGNNFLFYVPPGVKQFNIIKNIAFKLIAPGGRIVDVEDKKEGEVAVDVKPGEEGLWKIAFFTGNIYIEGVPPYLGVNASQMLVPAYVK